MQRTQIYQSKQINAQEISELCKLKTLNAHKPHYSYAT